MAAGAAHTLGLKVDGSIVALGSDYYGQTDVPAPNRDFVGVAAGGEHSLGLKSYGSIVAWGRNDAGQTDVPAPNTGFIACAAGEAHSVGLKASGAVVTWGNADQSTAPNPNRGFVAVAAGSATSVAIRRVPACNGNGTPDDCEFADCNGNCIPDEEDIVTGASRDCNANLIPDECDIVSCLGDPPCWDCNADGVPDGCGLADCAGDPACADCNGNGIADGCEPDCNGSQVPDDCDIEGGTSNDCNNNFVPDECESPADCNGNGLQDFCDIFAGTSRDCNHDAIPDECQLADNDCNANSIPDDCEPRRDCNRNGLIDICEVFEGTSPDCNANSVPDECDVLTQCSVADCNANGRPDECDIVSGESGDCNGNARPDECDLLIPFEDAKVSAANVMPYDGFGTSVSIDGDVAAVGSPRDYGGSATSSGSVSIFRPIGGQWAQEATLTALSTTYARRVGQYIAIDGDAVIAGAVSSGCSVVAKDDGCATAYVFRSTGADSGWVQEAELRSQGGPGIEEDEATPVALSGDIALLAAPRRHCSAGYYCGAVDVFRRVGSKWDEEATLTPSDLAAVDAFGTSIAVHGNLAVVGKPYGDAPGAVDSGSAYVFEFTNGTWMERAQLSPPNPISNDTFGRLVSIDGTRLVVVASSGAYVYRVTASPAVWQPEATLIPSVGWIESISLEGETIVLGGSASGCPQGGFVTVFRFDAALGDWVEGLRLAASDAASSNHFGGAVALRGSTVLVGASGANCIAGIGCGAAYFFTPFRDRDCNNNNIPDQCEDCNANGIADECDIAYCTGDHACADCNFNSIPDGCEVDCDSNGIPDECDLAACSGDPGCADRNDNSIPDGCEAGACCDGDTFGGCTDGLFRKECNCPRCEWTAFATCDDVECSREAIPTVSAWGLAILSLLLLTGAKIRFGRMWRAEAG